jgi:hypothetical protein
MIYLHVSRETLSNIKSPLDLFDSTETTQNSKEASHEPNR